MRSGEEWYQGTADSVYQNLYLLERHSPKLVAVFGADHIYRMNVRQMIDEHQRKSADVTVAALPVKIEEASQFGVISVDADWRIIGFDEKPKPGRSIATRRRPARNPSQARTQSCDKVGKPCSRRSGSPSPSSTVKTSKVPILRVRPRARHASSPGERAMARGTLSFRPRRETSRRSAARCPRPRA